MGLLVRGMVAAATVRPGHPATLARREATPGNRSGPGRKTRPGPHRSRSYSEEMTLLSVFLIAVLSRPRVTTTAIVITPRTTAYSAMVWPASSRTSADSVVKNSLMGLTSPGGIDGIPVVPIRSEVSAQAGIALFSEFSFL